MGTEEEHLKCPVCQDLFTDPVTLPCGHHFCLTCIHAVWDSPERVPLFCPECQIFLPPDLSLEIDVGLQTKVCRNSKMADAVYCDHCIESASVAVRTCLTCDACLCRAHATLHRQKPTFKEHTVVEVTSDPWSLKCREHRDELKLFCLEDRVSVCCLCVLVGSHKNHRAAQLHEACTDLKTMLESSMKQLLEQRCEAEHAIKDLESLYTQTVTSASESRERISDKYSRIRAVLDGDERLMMQIIEAEESCVTEWLEVQRGIMEAKIQEIDQLRESTKSLLQESNELRFLQQITDKNLCDPPKLAPTKEVDKSLCDPDKLRTVEKLVDDLSVALSQHFPRMWSYLSCPELDPKTAHPNLEVSQDRRQVSWRQQRPLEAEDAPPYDSQYSVSALHSLASGQHYWEVAVQEKPYWLIGVTTGPGDKKPDGKTGGLGVNVTTWGVYHGDGRYLACHDAQENQLSVEKRVRKLGVYANIQKGELSFYDADTMTLLHSFCLDREEPLYPMFNPCIDMRGINRQPLTLFWIKEPWNWNDDGLREDDTSE